MRSKLIFIILCLIPVYGITQSDWKEIRTVEQACEAWPEIIDSIFTHLDLQKEGLEKVAEKYHEGDLPAACTALLTYYETSKSTELIPQTLKTSNTTDLRNGDSILRNIFTFQRVPGEVPTNDDDHRNWFYQGPEEDAEWAWMMNRHIPLQTLIRLYHTTGEERYISFMDQFIRDWILESRPYPARHSSTSMWRGLEVSFRVKTWATIFFSWMGEKGLAPATRLLILSTLPEHAHYARHFHGQNNWLTMEMSGLASVAAYWPEFRDAGEWMNYAIESMVESIKNQVYPDGAQTELSSHYHRVAISNFSLFEDIINHTGQRLPEDYTRTLEKMWNYLALTIKPDGYGLLNNDSDLDYNRDQILSAAARYDRPDWEYIATNGESGNPPKSEPSYVFPWAGQMISRSDFGSEAHWSFFDAGPWGTGHQHNDKLHLSVSAYGRDFLVDGGRFAYRGETADKFRKYALGSQSHNVLLIDGHGQGPGPAQSDYALDSRDYTLTEDFDFATASYSHFPEIKGAVKHSRSVYYHRGGFWVVVDQVATDRSRKIEALWHWHPDCDVKKKGETVFTNHDTGNLRIVPLGDTTWEVELIRGQEKPEIQGWYSPEYNVYTPSTASIYRTHIDTSSTFIWLIYPSQAPHPEIKTAITDLSDTCLSLQVNQNNETDTTHIPLPDQGKRLDNAALNGYRGIWFELGQKSAYGDKYSGGLGTYTAKHLPLAVYAPEVNRTFFVYGGTPADSPRHLLCMIGVYDHETQKVSRPVVVRDKEGVTDPHDNPSLMIDEEGYIWVYVSGRGRKRPGFKYRSRAPYSISHFDLITEEEMTYPQPHFSNKVFLNLFTKYTGVRQLYFQTSPDGRNWSEDQKLAAIPENPGEPSGHYQISATYRGEKTGTFFNRHPHGNVDKRTDIYYVETGDGGQTWTDIRGGFLSLPIKEVASPARVRDFAREHKNIYLKDMDYDEKGRPVGLFIKSRGHEPGPDNAPYEWFVFYWDGNQWQESVITSSDHNYDMGSLYLSEDSWKIVGPVSASEDSPQPWGVGGELEVWESKDDGKSWRRDKILTQNSKYNHSYVRRPIPYQAPFSFFWADGDPHHFSPSRLYIGDFSGNIWKLPEKMHEEWVEPQKIKKRD